MEGLEFVENKILLFFCFMFSEWIYRYPLTTRSMCQSDAGYTCSGDTRTIWSHFRDVSSASKPAHSRKGSSTYQPQVSSAPPPSPTLETTSPRYRRPRFYSHILIYCLAVAFVAATIASTSGTKLRLLLSRTLNKPFTKPHPFSMEPILPLPLPASLPPANEVPSAFFASVKQWWTMGEKQSAIAEERLLRRLPFFSDPNHESGLKVDRRKVELTNPKHFINTVSIQPRTPPSTEVPPPAVFLHGYGAGLGFFFKNFPALSKWASRRGTAVHLADWMGMGLSARPGFSVKAGKKDIDGRVQEAESFFIDSLEDWRTKMGLEKMTLVGHSLGAYLSVAYTLKYPDRVNKLILLSPAGVPRPPPEGEHGGSRTRKLFMYLWEEGYSPFQLVRNTFVWAPMLVGKYSARRFTGLTDEDVRDMHDYLVGITLKKGSGEYCISHLLAPGAYARHPIVDRIASVKVPVTFAYGDRDWMDPEGGQQCVEVLRKHGNGEARMYVVGNAGHHCELDSFTN